MTNRVLKRSDGHTVDAARRVRNADALTYRPMPWLHAGFIIALACLLTVLSAEAQADSPVPARGGRMR